MALKFSRDMTGPISGGARRASRQNDITEPEMRNFEHAAIVAELNAGIDAACHAVRAATAAGDSAAADAARADVSRLVNDLQVAEEMEAVGRADDATHARDDLRSASEAVLAGAIDSMNRALLGVGIRYLVGPEEEGLVSAAHNIAVARQRYEQAQRAVVETTAALTYLDGVIGETEALRELCIATALLERRQAQVLARVVKQHIEHAEAATTAACAASDRIGDATDRCLGAGAWAKLLAG
ncbi:hypothetical protein [Paraburkholderia hospita]|uniref:hypothetical protein n=1 Tax=Paraburkholderia hospita TaxID=169430 RepID=UPI003ECF6166